MSCHFFVGGRFWVYNVFGDRPISKWPITNQKKKKNPKNISVLGCMVTIELINMNHNKYHYNKRCPCRPNDFIGF